MTKYIKRIYFSLCTIPVLIIVCVTGVWEIWTKGSTDDLDFDFWN